MDLPEINVDDNKDLIKFIMDLIRAHYEPSNCNEFDCISREIARYFDKNGRGQLASYIQILNGADKNVWIPM